MKIFVRAHPNSKKSEVKKLSGNVLEIWLPEPAIEDKANRALIGVLAEYFKVGKMSVRLLKGGHSKTKLFEVAL